MPLTRSSTTPPSEKSDKLNADESLTEDQNFLVEFDENDERDPKNMSVLRKWFIVLLLCVASISVTATASIYTSTYEQLQSEFHISNLIATLGLAAYGIGLGFGPLFIAPLSEFYGRRPIYLVAWPFFIIWLIPCAVAHNIETIIIARFIGGCAGSAFLSVAGGTVGDIFTVETLQQPMLAFSAGPLLGSSLGPFIGGFVNYYLSWRWTFYILLIWAGSLAVGILTIIPETYAPVLHRKKARKLRQETGDERWKASLEILDKSVFWTVVQSLYRPFMMLALDPMLLCLCTLTAILLGILYLFFGAFHLVYSEVYHFNLWQVGCVFLGILSGVILGISMDPIWQRTYAYLINRAEKQAGEKSSEPEFRLPPAIVGGWLCVIGIFWFAWTIYPSIHWIIPTIGTAFFGMGIPGVFSGVFTFLVEAYPLYAASALGANSCLRNMFCGAFPLFGNQMYQKLGFHWASTLLGFLTLALAPFPYVFFVYGKRLRAKSKFGGRRQSLAM